MNTEIDDSIVLDAMRYRWLREGNDAKHGAAWHVAVNLYGCEWDAAIDAAIAAAKGDSSEPYESGAVIDMNAAHKTVSTFVDADASIGQCALGVGDGTGSLFVYGSYEAIKRVQEIIFENERLRASARN